MSKLTTSVRRLAQNRGNENYSGSPIVLQSSAALTPGSAAMPNMVNLTSPYRVPMVIDEIKFYWVATGGVGTTLERGGHVKCRFRLGPHDLSNTHVPLWGYGTRLADQLRQLSRVTGDNNYSPYMGYRWVLPKAMFVPAGMSLIPSFIFDRGILATDPVTVFVSIVGRLMTNRPANGWPKKTAIPYIGYYETPNITSAGGGPYTSPANTLFNPFQKPLQVQRFLGHIRYVDTSDAVSGASDLATTFNDGIAGTIELRDSLGYSIVPAGTPWAMAFEHNRKAWTFSRSLAPKEYYTFTHAGMTGLSGTTTINGQVSMVGYREEAI